LGRIVAAGAQVEIHLAALPLDLIHLAFAVLLAAGLEGKQFSIPRERLEGCEQLTYRHALRVATECAK
jgi:hypothetical protein